MCIRDRCSNKKQIANTISNLKIAIYNREVLKSIQKNIEIEYDFKSLGILQLIRNIKTMEGKISDSQFLEDMGCKNQILSRESCLKLEPALKDNYSQIIGGISIPSDASGDAHKFTRGLEAECKKLGVKFKYNEEITHIKVDNNKIFICFKIFYTQTFVFHFLVIWFVSAKNHPSPYLLYIQKK